MPVELPHTDQQGRVVALDLGQAEVDPGIEGVGGRLIEEVGQLAQPVTDSVEDRRLQPYRVLEAVEGVEEAADSCLTLGRQRPLEVLPLEFLRGGVHGAVVLGGVEQAPSDQGGQSPLERGVVRPLLPPHRAQGPPHLVEVECRGDHRCLVEGGHEADVQIP